MSFFARDLRQILRRADAGDDVFALGVHEELAVKLFLAGRWIAREGDASRRVLAHVAEHHRLHVDGRAPRLGDSMQAAVGDRACVHPRAEYGTDRAPELLVRVLRKRLAVFFLYAGLVALHDLDPVAGIEIGVEYEALLVLVVFEDVFEVVVIDVEHHVRIHLYETAIGIVGEALVVRGFCQRFRGFVVEPEVQDRIHHARHRGARAGAHGDE